MSWADRGNCVNQDTNKWFDLYEENPQIRPTVDGICDSCPVQKNCLIYGYLTNSWGVWGGVYLEDGKPSKEYTAHRNIETLADMWTSMTMEML